MILLHAFPELRISVQNLYENIIHVLEPSKTETQKGQVSC